jgi:hypothetical protein
MRLPKLSPTLLALVAASAWGHLGAATVAERDSHFDAVRALIDADVLRPAERQRAEFQNAAYPDAELLQKFLDWDFGTRFHTTDPAQLDALEKEIEAAVAKDAPEVVKVAWKAAGDALIRNVNELMKPPSINPDDPPPITGKDNIPKQDRDRRNLLVQTIIANADRKWKEASQKVKDFEAKQEQDLWNLDDKDPKFTALAQEAVSLRIEALKPLYFAHIALREVITRGAEFGIDPAPATSYFQTLLKENKEWIGKWDYDWGDYDPRLKYFANVLLAEAVRQKISGINPEDIEGEFFKVTDLEVKKYSAAAKEEVLTLQVRTWAELLRWRLEMGDEKSLKKGVDTWNQLKDRIKDGHDLMVKLGGGDERAQVLAQAYIAAARIFAAKKDLVTASGVLVEVSNSRNPLAQNAKNWMAFLNKSGGSGGGGGWGTPIVPQEPETALALAKAFIGQANANENFKESQAAYMRAAVALRNGVLGLTNGAYDEEFVKCAPDIYYYYASAFYKLNMHYHAAIAAQEGLRVLGARVTEKTNPWRQNGDKTKPFTSEGQSVSKLARSALSFASVLTGLTGSSNGAQGLYNDTIKLVEKLSPEDAGKSTEWIQVALFLNQGDFDSAIAAASKYATKYKDDQDEFYKAMGLISNAYMRKYEALEKRAPNDPSAKSEMDKAGADLTALAEKIAKPLREKPADKLTPAERKALSVSTGAPIFIDLKSGRNDSVIKSLNVDWWKNAPADEELRADMLRHLCRALANQQEAALKDANAAKDPQTYLAAAPTQLSIYRDIYVPQLRRFKDDDAKHGAEMGGKLLAIVFNKVAANGEAIIDAKVNGSEKLAPVVEDAKKALADLLYPRLKEDSKPSQLLATGGLLWDMEDHERAARLYEWWEHAVADDSDLQLFRRNPKGLLDQAEAIVAQRPELKADWAGVRTLLEDTDDLKKARALGLPREQWGTDQVPIDYLKAVLELRKYRKKIEGMKTVIGADGFAKINEALNDLEKTVSTLAQDIVVKKRLASFYRESNRGEEARKLYQVLIDYDPEDPDSASALVENVLSDIKNGQKVPDEQIKKAREISAGLRDDAKDPFISWTAQIQVLELSAALGDIEMINRSLKLLKAGGDLSYFLIAPPVRADAKTKGDDKRVRRAKNAEAVAIAERFLKTYDFKGVVDKPGFRIDKVDADGKEVALFVDVAAPKIVGTMLENEAGDEVVVFRAEGDSPGVDAKDAPKKADEKKDAKGDDKKDEKQPDAKPAEGAKP